ncbi:hypothetical protein BHE74_00005636 [Ensete ventricosum]|nr:hypothetical protein BHE74_00005636 [Ensete ventricosum]RZR92639.1 hypothetical protein BHM03_00020994 [Ensete ventricosum]
MQCGVSGLLKAPVHVSPAAPAAPPRATHPLALTRVRGVPAPELAKRARV